MPTRREVLTSGAALALLGVAPVVHGAETVRTGVIDELRPRARLIVINDAEYEYRRDIKVYEDGSKRRESRDALAPGMHVRFSVHNEGGGRAGRVMRMWILNQPPAASTE